MSQTLEKLKNLLAELFQIDQPELDFGIYRVMHARSADVTQFLDKDLLPQVNEPPRVPRRVFHLSPATRAGASLGW